MSKSGTTIFCTMLLSCSLAGHAAAEVKCGVADQTPASRYVVNGNEVFDQKTGLTWARCAIEQKWIDGKGCAGPIKAYKFEQITQTIPEKWRLPTISEIISLAVICPTSAANREVFYDISLEIALGVWISDKSIGEGRPVVYSSVNGKNNIYLGAPNGTPIILVKKSE